MRANAKTTVTVSEYALRTCLIWTLKVCEWPDPGTVRNANHAWLYALNTPSRLRRCDPVAHDHPACCRPKAADLNRNGKITAGGPLKNESVTGGIEFAYPLIGKGAACFSSTVISGIESW